MSELTVGSVGGLAVNNNIISVASGHQISGSVFNTYPGAIIKTQHYNTGYGAGARNTPGTDWAGSNISGTGATGTRNSSNGNFLQFEKIHNNSELMINIKFPYYISTGSSGFGIRCQLRLDETNNYLVDILENGPAHGWGAGGYGGNDAGIVAFSWFTGDNPTVSSLLSSRTGIVEFWFQSKKWNSGDTFSLIDYDNTYPKYGVIDIFEVAQ